MPRLALLVAALVLVPLEEELLLADVLPEEELLPDDVLPDPDEEDVLEELVEPLRLEPAPSVTSDDWPLSQPLTIKATIAANRKK